MAGSKVSRREFGALVVGAALVAAGVAPGDAQVGQVPLTAASIEALIASYPDVKATAAGLHKKYGNPGAGQETPSAWGAWMAVGAAQGALDASVQAHGFDSFSSWLQVLTSVATAYGVAKSGSQINAGMADAIKQIQNNSSLSDAQKQMMIQQMQASMGTVAAMAPPDNDAAVTPYLNQLAALFQQVN